ncbi:hypothetical protein [Nocardioides sp. CFH 31398]|uniref:hypothetical protein n=1 Tax=Nocardioides sp. CFH 31398 TaxID=2919579 RepID=UPI001F05489B|nr:hypothetical protein [Nocardioides sp. CFH 31398]MCH1867545.1 hypothetical protein [Nocardioides sp. CFH 31398]
MHFHAVEQQVHGEPHQLDGVSSLAYPSDRPAFATVGEAIDAVMDSALLQWGAPAEDAVELALMAEIGDSLELSEQGALASWVAPDGNGAVWSVRACDCADGTLALIFAHHRRGG